MEQFVYLGVIIALWVGYYVANCVCNKKYTSKTKSYDSLAIIHKDCYSFNARHIYIVKFYYGKPRKKFFFLTTIRIEFVGDNGQTGTIVKIAPHILFNSQKESFKEGTGGAKKEKLMAFILQTKTSLESFNSLRVRHDCRTGDLFVYRIKIIDLIQNDSFNTIVNSFIKFLPPGADPSAQRYNCTTGMKNKTDIKPSPFLSCSDTLLFLVFGIHVIIFHIEFDILSGERRRFDQREDSDKVFQLFKSAGIAYALATVPVVVFLAIYYWIVKRFYSELRGIGMVWLLESGYKCIIVFLALLFGLSAVLMALQLFTKDSITATDDKLAKILSLTIAFLMYCLTFFTLFLLCYYFGFFRRQTLYDLMAEDEVSSKSDRAATDQLATSASNITIDPHSKDTDSTETDTVRSLEKPNISPKKTKTPTKDKDKQNKAEYGVENKSSWLRERSIGSDFQTHP